MPMAKMNREVSDTMMKFCTTGQSCGVMDCVPDCVPVVLTMLPAVSMSWNVNPTLLNAKYVVPAVMPVGSAPVVENATAAPSV